MISKTSTDPHLDKEDEQKCCQVINNLLTDPKKLNKNIKEKKATFILNGRGNGYIIKACLIGHSGEELASHLKLLTDKINSTSENREAIIRSFIIQTNSQEKIQMPKGTFLSSKVNPNEAVKIQTKLVKRAAIICGNGFELWSKVFEKEEPSEKIAKEFVKTVIEPLMSPEELTECTETVWKKVNNGKILWEFIPEKVKKIDIENGLERILTNKSVFLLKV